MKIENTTQWETEDLRKLFSQCIKRIKKAEGKGKIKGIKVVVKNRREHWISGRGYIGIYSMTIMVGKLTDFTNIEKRKVLAQVFTHEYYHNLGYKYIDGRSYRNDFTRKWDYSWVADYPIRRAEPKQKVVKDIQMERYQEVVKKVATYISKVKRYQTLLRKYKVKQNYYEKKLVMAGKIKLN